MATDTFKKIKTILDSNKNLKLSVLVLIISLAAILETITIASLYPLIEVVTADEINTNSYLYFIYAQYLFDPKNYVMFLGVMTVAFVVISTVFRFYAAYVINRYAEHLGYGISSTLLKKYLSQSYIFFTTKNSNELIKNLISENDQFVAQVARPVLQMLANIVILILVSIFLAFLNLSFLVVTISVLLFLYGGVFLFLKSELGAMGFAMVDVNKHRFKLASEIFSNIKYIKVTRAEKYFSELFADKAIKYSNVLAKYHTFYYIPNYLIEAIAVVSFVIFIVYFSDFGFNKNDIPLLSTYFFAAFRLKPVAQSIYHGISGVRYGVKIVHNIYSDLMLPIYPHDKIENSYRFHEKIVFEDVVFKYKKSDTISFSCTNLTISKGHFITVVGESGSGKSTFADILMGELKPDSGRIIIDEHVLGLDLGYPNWLENISFVPQEVFLNDDSVRNNILFDSSSSIDHELYLKAMDYSLSDEFVSSLLKGDNTKVGDKGVQLSGGQKQRLGIARALYKDKAILILDEATSALDENNQEKLINNLLQDLSKTVIFITHDLSIAAKSDLTIFIKDGVVNDVGTYQSLLNSNQFFKEICSNI